MVGRMMVVSNTVPSMVMMVVSAMFVGHEYLLRTDPKGWTMVQSQAAQSFMVRFERGRLG